MAGTLARLVVEVGVKLDGALKVESKIKGLKRTTEVYAASSDRETSKVRAAFKRMGAGIKKVGAVIGRALKGAVMGMAGMAAGAGAAAAAVFRFVDSQTQAIDALNKGAAATGTNIQELQRLQFAASQSGVAADTLSKALEKFNANLFDISKGSGKLAREALKDLGLSFDQIKGHTRTEQLKLIADGLKEVDDGGRRAAIASKLFGQRAGPQLSILLNEGSEGIQKLVDQTQGVFTQEDADRATAFQDRMGEVKNVVKGLASDLAIKLQPQITEAVEGFGEWVKENDGIIKQDLAGAVKGIAAAFTILRPIVSGTMFVFRQLGAAMETVLELEMGPEEWAKRMNVRARLAAAKRSLAEVHERGAAADADYQASLKKLTARADKKLLGMLHAKVRKGGTSAVSAEDLASLRSAGMLPKASRRATRRGAKKAAAKKKKEPSLIDIMRKQVAKEAGVTVPEAIAALLSGDQDVLTENLRGLASSTPSTKSIKPTVAIDFFNFKVIQNITAPDAKDAARQSSEAIRREFRKANAEAGNALAGNVVR